jgi:hypothetical protein
MWITGQTGSGKSYSMMGTDRDPGIIPRICRALFYMIKRHGLENGGVNPAELSAEDRPFTVEASYLEIYNEVSHVVKCISTKHVLMDY